MDNSIGGGYGILAFHWSKRAVAKNEYVEREREGCEVTAE